MMRIADRLARKAGARALVTGEALGQVASQTLENLATIDRASTLPILRPLIAYDKREVIDEARRCDMPRTTLSEDEDCCRLFAPAEAAIRSGTDACIAIEREMPIDALLDAAVEAAEKSLVVPAWPASPREE
jgi:thiamine biosynthesis protein ThiI